jgi:hypothetical protein
MSGARKPETEQLGPHGARGCLVFLATEALVGILIGVAIEVLGDARFFWTVGGTLGVLFFGFVIYAVVRVLRGHDL